MQNKSGALILAAVIGVITGVTIVALRTSVQSLVDNQKEMLNLQRTMQAKLGSEPQPASTQKIRDLENRMDDLERQLKGLDTKVGLFKGAPTPPTARPDFPQEDFSKAYTIPINNSPVRGKKDAPITIVEFVDYQCPFCSRFHPVLNDVIAAYPDKVKYLLKNFPLTFHQQAKPAAKAALAAGEQGKYWEMSELILGNNRDLSDAKLEEYAKQIGLNLKKFKQDLEGKDAEYEKIIQDDLDLGYEVQVRGTPTFYLEGKKTQARTLDVFKQEIDQVIKERNL